MTRQPGRFSRKGRMMVKINLKEANKIRQIYMAGGKTQEELAVIYDVKREYISKILRNVRHITNNWYGSKILEIAQANRGDKLTMEIAWEIRELYKSGNHTYTQLADKFGVNAGTIGEVIRNEIYKSNDWDPSCVEEIKHFNCVVSKEGEGSSSASLTQDEVDDLRKIYLTNKYTQNDLAKMFSIGKSAVHEALHNKTYKDDTWDTDHMHDCAKENNPKGEGHGMHKLTESEVLQIRRLYARGLYTYDELGVIYCVTGTCIGYVVRMKTWRHI